MNCNTTISKFSTLSAIVFLLITSALTSLYGQDAASLGFVEGVNYDHNIIFKNADGTNVKLDIYYPDAAKLKENNNPWMLFVHGGGWAGGKTTDIFKNAFTGSLENFIDSGIIVANVNYRLASDNTPMTSYESTVDIKDAIKYLVKNADQYKLDAEEYGIWGGSAGGHLCLVAALAPDSSFIGDPALADITTNVKCVASYFPFTSCLNANLRPSSIFEDGTLFSRLLGGTLAQKPEMARLLSPALDLKESSPSILLLHGKNDATLPIINSTYMMEVAAEVNADVQLLTVNGAGHSFGGSNISPSLEGIALTSSDFVLSRLNRFKTSTLAAIEIEGLAIDTFNFQTYSYDIVLEGGTTSVPNITGIAIDSNAVVTVTPASALPGSTTIEVKDTNNVSHTYTINLRVKSSEAKLSKVSLNLKDFTDFRSDSMAYTIVLDANAIQPLYVMATALDQNAQVVVTQASSVLGSATITVTAEDSITSLVYTINFTIINALDAMLDAKMAVFPNPASEIININSPITISTISLSSATGANALQINNVNLKETSISISTLKAGYYFLKIETLQGVYTQKVIVD